VAHDPNLAKKGDKTAFDRLVGEIKRTVKVIPLPGRLGAKGGKVGLRAPLNDDEMYEARREAQNFVLEKQGQDALRLALDEHGYDEEFDRQILVRALRDPNDPDSQFFSIEQLRRALNVDTRRVLMQAYNDMRAQEAPDLSVTEDKEIQAILEAEGKESAASACASYYDRDTLVRIVIAQAEELTRRRMQNSSATTASK
jgi:hypothetical protein